MALTRARVVAGRPAIRARAARAIAQALAQPHDPAQVRADAADMRRRLARDLPPERPLGREDAAGRRMEVEFVAQVLQLVHGAVPGGQNTVRALDGLAASDALPENEAAR